MIYSVVGVHRCILHLRDIHYSQLEKANINSTKPSVTRSTICTVYKICESLSINILQFSSQATLALSPWKGGSCNLYRSRRRPSSASSLFVPILSFKSSC